MVRRAKRDPLTPLVDRYLVERKSSPKPWIPPNSYPRPPGRFSPSIMGPGVCHRRAAFGFMGVPQKRTYTPELNLIFHVGDWTHWGWYGMLLHAQDVLGTDTFEVLGIEQSMTIPKWYVGGRYDILVAIHGRPWLLDFKTINDAGFGRRVHARRADPDHEGQLLRYLRGLKIRRGMVVYLNKNDQRYKPYPVTYSKEAWADEVRWLKPAITYLERRMVPPKHRNCYKDSPMMRDCPFKHLCYGPKRVRSQLDSILYEGKPTYQELWDKHN